MKVTTENVETREVVLTIEPDADRINRAKRQAASAMSRWRPVPGFRPGKAPLGMVERIFGADTVLNEAVHSIANELFREAVKEADIEPFEAGELEVESQDPVQIKVKVALAPVVELGDYKSLRIEPEPDVVVTDEMVNGEIDALREEHAIYEPVERPALHGDQVVLQFKATADGETVHEDDAFEFEMDPQTHPVMLVETVLGMTAGQSAERDIDFHEDYDVKALAGKSVHASWTLTQVREKKLPEVDDEFAKEAGDYESAEDMRSKIRDRILHEMQDARDAREREAAVKALVEAATIEYPAVAVDREVDSIIDNEKSRLRSMGFDWENYLRMVRRSEADIRSEARPQAQERLLRRLALGKFAEAEGIEVANEEIEAELDRFAQMYGGDNADDMRRRLVESGAIYSIHNDLLTRRTINRLVAMVTGRPEAEEPAAETSEETEETGTDAEAPEAPQGEQPSEDAQ